MRSLAHVPERLCRTNDIIVSKNTTRRCPTAHVFYWIRRCTAYEDNSSRKRPKHAVKVLICTLYGPINQERGLSLSIKSTFEVGRWGKKRGWDACRSTGPCSCLLSDPSSMEVVFPCTDLARTESGRLHSSYTRTTFLSFSRKGYIWR
jgi:hypothetical protein